MHLNWKHMILAAGLAAGCLQTVSASDALPRLDTASTHQEAAFPTITTSFKVIGNAKGGLYRQIQGSLPGGSLSLSLEQKSSVVVVGGISVEGNPTFFVTGLAVGKKIDLKIIPEDLISNIDGMKVQTGTIYHITGTLAGEKINAVLTKDETVSDAGGMKIVTDIWASLKSHDMKGPKFELRGVSVSANVGGINIEQDRYHTWKGCDRTGTADFTIRDWVSEKGMIKVSGQGSPDSLVLLLALRPFLNI